MQGGKAPLPNRGSLSADESGRRIEICGFAPVARLRGRGRVVRVGGQPAPQALCQVRFQSPTGGGKQIPARHPLITALLTCPAFPLVVRCAPVNDRRQSPIFVKTYDLQLWLLERTARFPKHERFRIARRVEESMFSFYDLILQAGRLGDERTKDKRRLLLQADLELDRLRLTIRLCQDLKLLSFKQYAYCAEQLVEIGRLLGGWLKTVGQQMA